jgi:hypothetical protein
MIGATSLLIAMIFGAIGRVCFGVMADRVGALTSYAQTASVSSSSRTFIRKGVSWRTDKQMLKSLSLCNSAGREPSPDFVRIMSGHGILCSQIQS